MATLKLFRRERKLGRAGSGFLPDLGIVVLTMSFALIAHLVEVALWAALFVLCGEFHSFAIAFFHSAVNYTTLGYGDLIMTPSWELLGRWKQPTARSCLVYPRQWSSQSLSALSTRSLAILINEVFVGVFEVCRITLPAGAS